MPYRIPSLDELRELAVASHSGRFPEHNVGRRSHQYKRLSALSLAVLDAHYGLYQAQRDVDPRHAVDEPLRRLARVWGVTPLGARGASGTAALRVFGTAGSTVPNVEALVHAPSGLLFETRNAGGTIPASGFLDVDVAATSTGDGTNLEAGQELQWYGATPSGLEKTSRIVVDLENGRDTESNEDLRERLLNRIGQPAAGGNRNDYEQFMLGAAAYVDSAYVFPGRQGLGTVDMAFLKAGSGTVRLPSQAERDEVLAIVEAERPVGSILRMLEVVAEELAVEVLVLPESDPAFAFDWDDSTPPTVASYDAGTRTITTAAAYPTDLSVGDRLVIADASADGSESVVESLPSSIEITLTEDLPFSPVATTPIYSGGPLVAAVRAVVQAFIDGLGPANPNSRYGPWNGTARLSRLFEAVQTATGVLDSQFAAPVANTDPTDHTFPNDDQVGLLVPGRILVRKDHS